MFKSPNQLAKSTLHEFDSKIVHEDVLKVPTSKAVLIKQLSTAKGNELTSDTNGASLFWSEMSRENNSSILMSDKRNSGLLKVPFLKDAKNPSGFLSYRNSATSTSAQNGDDSRENSLGDDDNTYRVFRNYSKKGNQHEFDAFRRKSYQWSNLSTPEPQKEAEIMTEDQIVEQVFEVLKDKNIVIWKEGMELGQQMIREILKYPNLQFSSIEEGSESQTNDESLFQKLMFAVKKRLEGKLPQLETEAQPLIKFSAEELKFTNTTGQVTTIPLLVTNFQDRSVHYEWIKQDTNFKIKQYTEQRFYFYPKSGVILPYSQVEFKISFKSKSVGLFKEKWEFKMNPEIPDSEQKIITFRGFSTCRDEFKAEKENISLALCKREVESDIENVIFDIIDHVFAKIDADALLKEQQLQENYFLKQRFLEQQKDFPLIKFDRESYFQLDSIYQMTMEKHRFDNLSEIQGLSGQWNASITSLYEAVSTIKDQNFVEKTSDSIEKIIAKLQNITDNSLLVKSSVKQTILRLSDAIVEVCNPLRKQFSLPLERSSVLKFKETDQFNEIIIQDPSAANDPKKQQKENPVDPKKAKAPAPVPEKGKSGKKEEDSALKPLDSEQTVDSFKNWSRDRKQKELEYKRALFQTMLPFAREIVGIAVNSLE